MQLSDSHLLDNISMEELAPVAKRSTGYFLKIMSLQVNESPYANFSPALANIIQLCLERGIECIEFDCDAQEVDKLPVFSW